MKLRNAFGAGLLGIAMLFPVASVANTQLDLPEDNCLTWTLVGKSRPNLEALQLYWDAAAQQARKAAASIMASAPARLGFYLGAANDPPMSIVGQDFKQDLAGRIKYGFYLVSTF